MGYAYNRNKREAQERNWVGQRMHFVEVQWAGKDKAKKLIVIKEDQRESKRK